MSDPRFVQVEFLSEYDETHEMFIIRECVIDVNRIKHFCQNGAADQETCVYGDFGEDLCDGNGCFVISTPYKKLCEILGVIDATEAKNDVQA